MKQILSLTALVLLAGASAALAQTPSSTAPVPMQHHAHNPHKAAVRLSQQLGLSPDQTAKLEPIFADRQQQIRALEADTTLTEAQRKKQKHAIRKSIEAQMSGILSPSQMQQLKTMHREQARTSGTDTGV